MHPPPALRRMSVSSQWRPGPPCRAGCTRPVPARRCSREPDAPLCAPPSPSQSCCLSYLLDLGPLAPPLVGGPPSSTALHTVGARSARALPQSLVRGTAPRNAEQEPWRPAHLAGPLQTGAPHLPEPASLLWAPCGGCLPACSPQPCISWVFQEETSVLAAPWS